MNNSGYIAERDMKRAMLGLNLRDKIKNEEINCGTKVLEVILRVADFIWE